MNRALLLFAVLLGASAFALAGTAPSQEPPDEEALWKRISDDVNNNRVADAAQGLERFLKDFPKSARVPLAAYQLATLDERRGRRQEALDRYADFLDRFPGHENAPHALLQRAQLLRQMKRKEESKAEFKRLFKKYPGSNASQSGLWQYWNLENKNFQFSVNQTFAEDQPVTVSAYLRNIDRVAYRLFKLDAAALLKRLESGGTFANVQELMATVPAAGREKLREWSEEPETGGRRYQSVEVKLETPGPGLYIFQAEHDDIPIEVGIVVARYGLIVKTAPNRTIVFAVDRRTGRGVRGMSLRFAEGEKRSTGTTGEDGLYSIDRAFNGSVVGVSGSEIALSNAWSHGSGDEQRTYLFTDRPIYRPNQAVHFKAIHRLLKAGGEYENLPGRVANIVIRDPRHNIVYQKDHTTTASGSVAGEFRLGDEPPLGHYYIHSSLGGYGRFRVEEYRKPEFEVKARFEGGARLQGDELKVDVSVHYYFGSPVVDSEISYEVRRRPYFKSPWRCFYAEWDWYDDGDEEDDEDEAPGRRERHRGWAPEEVVTKGTGKTDKDGKFRMACSTAKADKDYIYSVIAKVVDRSRREVQDRAEVRVGRSNLELNVAASKRLYAPGDPIVVKAKLADLEGKPIRDHAIEITAATAEWRPRDGRGDYDCSEFFKGSNRTDERGVAEFAIPADKEGRVKIRCVATDARGTEIAEERWVWVGGRSWSAGFQNFTGLDLVPDREIYKSGETARVLVTTQVRAAHILFTVECDGIYRHELVKVKEHTAVVEVPIDGARHSPNVYFSAVTMSGNELLSDTQSISVPPADRLLNVKVRTDREKYRPREKAEVTVEVTDAAGKPVSTEISVGLVDESIYALQKELAGDIRKFFFARRWNRVALATSMHYRDWGRAGAKDAEAPQGAAFGRGLAEGKEEERARKSRGDDDGGMADTEVRGNFPDTWHWNPIAATDASGRLTFTTEVPDSLTTWRATVRAATADTKVGQARLEFIARKEVIIRLTTPRFFTQKDSCVVSGVIHNYRDDVDEVLVRLEAEGVELEGPRETRVRVKKGEDARVDWRVKALTAGTAKLLARAQTPKESDAMRLEIPILPHGSLMSLTRAGASEGTIREKVTLPETAIREATELTISVAPSVASQVAGALEYLAGYPYGCVEQTMSRFLPSVVASRAMGRMGVRNEKLEKDLPDMVMAGLQRLYNFQHYDGGWGWWEGDQSHPYMTAYVVYGLAKAREAGQPVDPNALERGLRALKNMIANKQADPRGRRDVLPDDTRAYLVFALSEAGVQDQEAMTELFGSKSEMSDYGRAILALALAKAGRTDEANAVLAALGESAKQGEAYCYWEGHAQRWHWMSHSIETTAYVLRAYGKLAPKDARIHKIVRWLAANRHGNRWHSTKDTAAIVYALSEYASASGELDADFALSVKVNGKELISARIDRSNLLSFDGTRVIKGIDVPAGESEIEITRDGKGVVYYSAHLKYFNAADTFKPSEGTVAITRTYSKVRWEGKEKIADELKEGDTLVSGDIVEVTLSVDASGLHEYMMIEDPIPAGFEVQKEEERFYGGWAHRRWTWWYSRIEARDEKVCVAATTLNGHQTVSYLLRAETPGEYRILPTRAWNMYVPEIAGSSAGFRLAIKDKP